MILSTNRARKSFKTWRRMDTPFSIPTIEFGVPPVRSGYLRHGTGHFLECSLLRPIFPANGHLLHRTKKGSPNEHRGRDRHRHRYRSRDRHRNRNALFRSGIIPIAVQARVQNDGRQEAKNLLAQLLRPPLFGREIPVAVEPDQIRLVAFDVQRFERAGRLPLTTSPRALREIC